MRLKPSHIAIGATLMLASCVGAPAYAAVAGADTASIVSQGITATGLAVNGTSLAVMLGAEYRSTMRAAAFCAALGFAVTVLGWLL